MEKTYRVFVVNPGSTSTKVAYFENEKCVVSRSIFHDSSKLMTYETINDQLDYRMFGILLLEEAVHAMHVKVEHMKWMIN